MFREAWKGKPGAFFMCVSRLRFISTIGILFLGVPSVTNAVVELRYATYLGGSKEEGVLGAEALTVDGDGFAYVAGTTASSDFPVTDGSTHSGVTDLFVAKLDPSGNGAVDLVWSTLLGGDFQEFIGGIALDALGNIYVSGSTRSLDFPTTDGSSGEGIYVVKLTGVGSLVYSTIIGAGPDAFSPEQGGIAVDGQGNAYVTGFTISSGFPITTGPPFNGGSSDAVVAKLTPEGAIAFSRFLGGIGEESGRGIAVDDLGNVYVTGGTNSPDFPTPAGVQTVLQGPSDAFLVKLDASGSNILYGTLLGGNEGMNGEEERGLGLAIDALGKVYVTGRIASSDFLTVGAFDPTHNGGNDVFLVKLDPTQIGANSLLYSTYLGGSSGERGTSISLDSAGNAYVLGRTLSNDFPTTPGAFDPTFTGRHEVFLARFNPNLMGSASLISSTYFGGKSDDGPGGIVAVPDPLGDLRVYFSGGTASRFDFPIIPGALDETYNGGQSDAFVAILLYPTPPELLAARVPDGSNAAELPLTVELTAGGDLTLSWELSCLGADNDFVIYEGILGDFTSHMPRFCSTGGVTTLTSTPAAGNTYYLVVPRTASREGSYGIDSNGLERPQSRAACFLQAIGTCP